MHSTVDRRERHRLFRLCLIGILGITVTAAGLLSLFGQPLLHVMFAAKYDQLGEYLPMAAILIIGLPIEAQLVWTLLSAGLGRVAVAALTGRLLVVLGGATIFVTAMPDAPFVVLIVAPVAATAVSIVVQGGALAKMERTEERASRRLAT